MAKSPVLEWAKFGVQRRALWRSKRRSSEEEHVSFWVALGVEGDSSGHIFLGMATSYERPRRGYAAAMPDSSWEMLTAP